MGGLKCAPNHLCQRSSDQEAALSAVASQGVLQLTADADKAFQGKDYSLAFEKCRQALSTFRLLPKLLSKLAAFYIHIGNGSVSALHALASIAFHANNPEPYAHAARVACRGASGLFESNPTLVDDCKEQASGTRLDL